MNRRMSEFTTVGVGGEADIEIVREATSLKFRGETVIGRGSKILVSDGGISGRVLVMRCDKVSVRGTFITAESGIALPRLSRIAAECGLSGLEWACGIPGSLGGAVVMNAGAFGGELSDLLVSAEVLTESGVVTVTADMLRPQYRRTVGLPRGVILSATIALTEGDRRKIAERMRCFAERRAATQPVGRTFGSTFRRVGGVSAGYYIERAGLKGYAVGGARISDKHANFIINEGGSAADIRSLIEIAKEKVRAEFGVTLTEEVIYLGEFA